AGAARRGGGPARRSRAALSRSDRALAAVRKRPRARLRPARPGPLPDRAWEARSGGATTRSTRPLHHPRVPARPRRDRGTAGRERSRRRLVSCLNEPEQRLERLELREWWLVLTER